MGGAEAVFHRPQQPVAGKAIALKGQHRIHQVLEHLRARQGALLGHVAHQQQGGVLALGDASQGGGTFPHLGHRTRGAAQFSVMEGLNGVNDRHRWPQRLQLLQHQLQIGFGEQLKISPCIGFASFGFASARLRQATPAQLHLLGRLLRTHVEHRRPSRHGAGALQQQGALTNARVAAHQHQGAGHQATAQHPIEFAVAAAKPLQGPLANRLDRLRASRLAGDNGFSSRSLGHRPPAPTVGRRSSFLLHQGVPAAAAGALAKKLAGLGSTAGADKKSAGLGHELRADERGLYEERWH